MPTDQISLASQPASQPLSQHHPFAAPTSSLADSVVCFLQLSGLAVREPAKMRPKMRRAEKGGVEDGMRGTPSMAAWSLSYSVCRSQWLKTGCPSTQCCSSQVESWP